MINKQIHIKDVNHFTYEFEMYNDWMQTFWEAFGSYISGLEYLTINEEGKVYMAHRVPELELI
jgi:hypothetical protein